MWDAEATRSERQGSESRLRIHALSSRAEFAFMAVAPLLPTMTTVGSVLTIGSPAISSAVAADPRSSRAESSRWRRSADGGDALSDQSCAMCVGEGAPPVHRVRSGSAIDSSLRRGTVAIRSARERRAPIGMRVFFARHTLHSRPLDRAASCTRPGKLSLRPAAKLPF